MHSSMKQTNWPSFLRYFALPVCDVCEVGEVVSRQIRQNFCEVGEIVLIFILHNFFCGANKIAGTNSDLESSEKHLAHIVGNDALIVWNDEHLAYCR